MVNKKFWLGFAVIAVIVMIFAFITCDNGNSTKTYTVYFNLNGGSGTVPSAQTVNEGESITLPSRSGLSRSDYTFGGWNTNADGTGTNYSADSAYTVTGNITLYAKWNTLESVTGLANKLTWLRANAKSDTSYTIEVDVDETIVPRTLSYDGRSNITVTLRGVGANRVVSPYKYYSSDSSARGAIFTVNSGVTLILDNNITLQGRDDSEVKNNASLVIVNGGTFIMNGGAISGNINEYEYNNENHGGGVCVGSGTFTMNGGTISGNTSSSSSFASYINSGNHGNSLSSGGGVYVGSGTFTMYGGIISGNAASSPSPPSDSYSKISYSYGGGVYVGSGTFDKTGGTIYGYDANDTVNSNVVKNSSGGVLSNRGHAVAVYVGTRAGLYRQFRGRETTAGPEVNLYRDGNSFSEGWESEIEIH